MKTKVIMMAFLMSIGAGSVFAKDKTVKFEVKGNCGMCEKRIEKAANSVEGVSLADWDKKTKMIEVTFEESETDIHRVQKAIAMVGHDTPLHKSGDDVYEKLPRCCKYDRNENVNKDKSQVHDHEHNHDHQH
ncbi:heavy-metal-associated domain-containing protein [Sunxiuqinia sp. A32]|uniref:heavy-metal-associated domain-containing protein n=1 Tax=Sunxiuqinia sp. A32 TaxID=3461496 RepID=UPI0040465B7C